MMLTGGGGFVGRHLAPPLKRLGAELFIVRKSEYDLTREADVARLFAEKQPQVVLHLAADVGGIEYVRSHGGAVYYQHTMMNTLLLEYARRSSVEKIVAMSSVNCYAHDASAPFSERAVFDGSPDSSMRSYGFSKRMMILQSQLYYAQHALQTVNLVCDSIYGPHDNFDYGKARVIPANIRRCVEAQAADAPEIIVWGTGAPTRDFVYVDDVVRALLIAGEHLSTPEPVNLGTGHPVRLKELIEAIAQLSGYKGAVTWDRTKPDGQIERYLDVTRATELGILPTTTLQEGLTQTIRWYRANAEAKGREMPLSARQ